jgi:hypothetical protein
LTSAFFDTGLVRYVKHLRLKKDLDMLGTILLVVLILLLLGALPSWGYSRNWGAGPSSGIGLLLVIVVVLLLLGRI